MTLEKKTSKKITSEKMTIEEIRSYCRLLAKKYGYELTVPVEKNSRLTRTLGRVKFINRRSLTGRKSCKPIKIEFADYLLQLNDSEILDTVKHEMAHYFVLMETGESHGHDALWKSWAIKLACNPRATVKRNAATAVKEEYKYILRCTGCGKIIGKYKRRGKVVKRPGNYRSLCCRAKISVETLKAEKKQL